MSTTTTATDSFEQLDDALAVVRALSKRIRVAAERGDSAALERLSAQREIASDRVTELLRLSTTMLPGDVR